MALPRTLLPAGAPSPLTDERRILHRIRDPLRSLGSLIRAHPDSAALLILLAACLVHAVLFFGAVTAIDVDAGRDFLVADLLVQGRILYRDVDYRFGPFAPWLHAALFRWFGTCTTVLFAAGAVAGSVIVLLTYLLARRVLPPAPAVVAALIVLQNAVYGSHYFIYAVPYTFVAVYGLLFSLLVLYGTLVVVDKGRSHDHRDGRVRAEPRPSWSSSTTYPSPCTSRVPSTGSARRTMWR